ncbi:hypothetical protein V5O48_003893, partial [Marasmius crinis-equi]
MSARPALKNFVSIGKGVYLRRAAQDVTTRQDPRAPNVILIFGWMAAKIGHLQKYTSIYEEMYPDATQVVVRNEPIFFISREPTRQALLQPVVEVLDSLGCLSTSAKGKYLANGNGTSNGSTPSSVPAPRILVHSFSN